MWTKKAAGTKPIILALNLTIMAITTPTADKTTIMVGNTTEILKEIIFAESCCSSLRLKTLFIPEKKKLFPNNCLRFSAVFLYIVLIALTIIINNRH